MDESMKPNVIRDFLVERKMIGFIVSIGCQKAAFSTKEELKKAICDYLDDPFGMEKKYYLKEETLIAPTRVNDCGNIQPLGMRPAQDQVTHPIGTTVGANTTNPY